MGPLILGLIQAALPLVSQLVQKHQQAQGINLPASAYPTVEQAQAILTATLDAGDAEWAGWLAAHPKPPTP